MQYCIFGCRYENKLNNRTCSDDWCGGWRLVKIIAQKVESNHCASRHLQVWSLQPGPPNIIWTLTDSDSKHFHQNIQFNIHLWNCFELTSQTYCIIISNFLFWFYCAGMCCDYCRLVQHSWHGTAVHHSVPADLNIWGETSLEWSINSSFNALPVLNLSFLYKLLFRNSWPSQLTSICRAILF